MYLTDVGFGVTFRLQPCFGDTGEFRVNHDAAAVFADDYFLVHLDFHLLLWRDAVETSAAGITLDIYYAKAVAGIVADTLECFECALVDSGLDFPLRARGGALRPDGSRIRFHQASAFSPGGYAGCRRVSLR